MALALQTWTITTLGDQLKGEINMDRNAAGGNIPDRLAAILQETYNDLWEMYDWRFRIRSTTITFSALAPTPAMPSNFDKLDSRRLSSTSASTNSKRVLVWTNDEQLFESERTKNISTTGPPQYAIIRPDAGATWGQVGHCTPTPATGTSYAYKFNYICTVPTLADGDASPVWPRKFHRLWHSLAMMRGLRAFVRNPNAWREEWAHFKALFAEAVKQNDETVIDRAPFSDDGYGDVRALASTAYQVGD